MLPAHRTTNTDSSVDAGHIDTPSVRLDVLAAVPTGSAIACTQGAFLRAFDEHPDVVLLRAHGRENLRAVAWVVASMASWADLTARPTWPVVQERTGLSRRSVARWLRWLQDRGLLGVVESGTTPRFAPMALSKDDPNRAAVYVLCVPEAVSAPVDLVSVEESGTPTLLVLEQEKDPYAGTRASRSGPLRGREELIEEKNRRPAWPRTVAARSRADRLALVERLQAEAFALRPASTRELRHVLRPWLLAGWTVAQLLHALDHEPDGTARTWTTAVRLPVGWLRSRLAAWLDEEHGRPRSAPGEQARAEQQAQRIEQDKQRRAAKAERVAVRDAERAFGDLVRELAGDRYWALVETVMGRHYPAGARLMPATAAEALTRQAIRDQLATRPDAATAQRRAVAAVIEELVVGDGAPAV